MHIPVPQKRITGGNFSERGLSLHHTNPLLGALLLQQTRQKSEEWLEKLQLPRYVATHIDKALFDQAIDTFLPPLPPDKTYFISIVDQQTKHRISLMGNKEEIYAELQNTPWEDYDIIVRTCYPGIYGGSIIVQKDSLYLEFSMGRQVDIAWGKIALQDMWIITKSPFDKSFKYSFDDLSLRNIIYKEILQKIPHHYEGFTMLFDYPGYYEFAIEHDTRQQKLTGIFMDYNPDIQELL